MILVKLVTSILHLFQAQVKKVMHLKSNFSGLHLYTTSETLIAQ